MSSKIGDAPVVLLGPAGVRYAAVSGSRCFPLPTALKKPKKNTGDFRLVFPGVPATTFHLADKDDLGLVLEWWDAVKGSREARGNAALPADDSRKLAELTWRAEQLSADDSMFRSLVQSKIIAADCFWGAPSRRLPAVKRARLLLQGQGASTAPCDTALRPSSMRGMTDEYNLNRAQIRRILASKPDVAADYDKAVRSVPSEDGARAAAEQAFWLQYIRNEREERVKATSSAGIRVQGQSSLQDRIVECETERAAQLHRLRRRRSAADHAATGTVGTKPSLGGPLEPTGAFVVNALLNNDEDRTATRGLLLTAREAVYFFAQLFRGEDPLILKAKRLGTSTPLPGLEKSASSFHEHAAEVLQHAGLTVSPFQHLYGCVGRLSAGDMATAPESSVVRNIATAMDGGGARRALENAAIETRLRAAAEAEGLGLEAWSDPVTQAHPITLHNHRHQVQRPQVHHTTRDASAGRDVDDRVRIKLEPTWTSATAAAEGGERGKKRKRSRESSSAGNTSWLAALGLGPPTLDVDLSRAVTAKAGDRARQDLMRQIVAERRRTMLDHFAGTGGTQRGSAASGSISSSTVGSAFGSWRLRPMAISSGDEHSSAYSRTSTTRMSVQDMVFCCRRYGLAVPTKTGDVLTDHGRGVGANNTVDEVKMREILTGAAISAEVYLRETTPIVQEVLRQILTDTPDVPHPFSSSGSGQGQDGAGTRRGAWASACHRRYEEHGRIDGILSIIRDELQRHKLAIPSSKRREWAHLLTPLQRTIDAASEALEHLQTLRKTFVVSPSSF